MKQLQKRLQVKGPRSLLRLTTLLYFFTFSNALSGEKDLYDFLWLDPDKKVFVLQNKIYPKNKSFYIDIMLGTNITSTFQDTQVGGLKSGYYFSEEIALEFSYLTYTNSNNSAYDSVQIVNGTEPFIRRPSSQLMLYGIWSPFYGKINTFNKIIYFDWYFGVGAGQFVAESNLDSVINPSLASTYKEENLTALSLKSGVKVHVTKQLHFGIEFINTNFSASTAKNPKNKSLRQSNDFVISMGVSF